MTDELIPLNLNPYPEHDRTVLGKAVYIYVLPQFVTDSSGNLITDSVLTSTLRWTLDPAIFSAISPSYNPLAVLIGIIFVTNSLDIKDLYMLDTRRRGGGARDSAMLSELENVNPESSSFWDMTYGTGMSYQKGGFILIRLPVELKDAFPDKNDIIKMIDRNITAGVQYKVEDLQGREW